MCYLTTTDAEEQQDTDLQRLLEESRVLIEVTRSTTMRLRAAASECAEVCVRTRETIGRSRELIACSRNEADLRDYLTPNNRSFTGLPAPAASRPSSPVPAASAVPPLAEVEAVGTPDRHEGVAGRPVADQDSPVISLPRHQRLLLRDLRHKRLQRRLLFP